MSKSKSIFYGWWILVARIVISFGSAASPFAVILKPLMNDFHTGRGEVSILATVSSISGAVFSYVVARLLENRSPKKFMLIGALMGGGGFLLCAAVNSLWQMYVLFFIIGAGFNGIGGSVPLVALIANWFVKRRGLALGIGFAGFPIGAMIITPIVGLIQLHLGWRATFLFAGLVTLVITLPLIIFVLKDKPEQMGLLPDGNVRVDTAKNTKITKTAISAEKLSLGHYFKTYKLWLICIGFALMVIAEMAVIQHEVSFLTDMGISTVLAASAFGFTAGFSGLGRLASGWLADRIQARYVVILLCILEIIGVLILLQARSMALVWIFVALWGFASGSFFSILPMIINDIYTPSVFNVVFGFINGLVYGAMALGVPLAGFIFDATGSYHLVFILAIAFYGIAMVSTYFIYGVKPGNPNRTVKLKQET